MENAFGVRRIEGVDHLRRDTQRVANRQGTAERRALQVFHDEVVGSDVVQDADMRMVQRRDRPRLLREAVAVTARERLDGDGPSEARIGRLVDLAHAPGAEERNDLVGSEAGAWRECHSEMAIIAGRLLSILKRSGQAANQAARPANSTTSACPLSRNRVPIPALRL